MSYIHPLGLAHLRARWTRPDIYRFAAPGSPEAVRPGWLDPRARPRNAVAEAKARAEHEDYERELRKLRCDFAWLKFEIAMRRYLQRKYSPDQPRVPAGSGRESGRWTDGGGPFVLDKPTRLAGEPPPLQRIHPDATYERDPEARRSLEYWRGQSTNALVESLKPGRQEPLKTYPDGRVFDGNTRIKILQERGYETNALPRVILQPSPVPPLRSRGGGGTGGLPTQQ